MLEFFTSVSKVYRARFQRPLWNKNPRSLDDPLEAMFIFLEGYAFERQGRSPAYPYAAVEAIKTVKDHRSKDFPQKVWNQFSAFFGHEKVNPKVNPLYHVCNKESECHCVWCEFKSENIILTSKKGIAEGQLKKAWEKVKSIRGVGPKIASFFLRDVAVQFELSPAEESRWVLQPVDVWVRKTVSLLKGGMLPDEDVARWVVANSNEPELANQGMWYFGAQIAGSDFKLRKSVEDLDYARELYEKHRESLKAAVATMES